MQFVDVKNDVAFRKIFGNENRKEVLISFLNAVLLLQEDYKIVDVKILTPYQLPDLSVGKTTIVDIKAKDQNGKEYIVEMQVGENEDFHKRVLYYAAKSYSAQIERGEDYKNLNPTFFIGILDFKVTKNKNYINRHKIVDIDTGENYIKDIEFNFIELPKFNKQQNELNSIVDQWVYFIKNAENLEVIPENIDDEGLKHAYQDAAKHNWSKLELESYDKVGMRQAMDKSARELYIRRGIEKGIAEAVDKAVSNALDKERENIENQINEKFELQLKETKLNLALKLIARNFSNDEIAEDTGLTIEQIEELRK